MEGGSSRRHAGNGRTVTYASFDMAGSIQRGTTTMGFAYDGEHARVIQTAGGSTDRTYYLDDRAGWTRREL